MYLFEAVFSENWNIKQFIREYFVRKYHLISDKLRIVLSRDILENRMI